MHTQTQPQLSNLHVSRRNVVRVCGAPSPVLPCAPFATTAQLYPGCRTDADCQAVGDPGAYCKANHRYNLVSTHHVYSTAQSPPLTD